MGKKHRPNDPLAMSAMAVNRKAGARAQRRASEAMERKSIPAIKKALRRGGRP